MRRGQLQSHQDRRIGGEPHRCQVLTGEVKRHLGDAPARARRGPREAHPGGQLAGGERRRERPRGRSQRPGSPAPPRTLVWNASGADVSAVMVDGRLLVEHGRYRLGDEGEIVRRGARAAGRLWDMAEAAGITARRDDAG